MGEISVTDLLAPKREHAQLVWLFYERLSQHERLHLFASLFDEELDFALDADRILASCLKIGGPVSYINFYQLLEWLQIVLNCLQVFLMNAEEKSCRVLI